MIVVKGGLEGMLSSSIVANRQVLFEVDGGMMDATMALFATYYVFMYEYPASLNNLFTYLQKCIFQIPMHGNFQRLLLRLSMHWTAIQKINEHVLSVTKNAVNLLTTCIP